MAPLALLVVLAAGVLLQPIAGEGLPLAAPDRSRIREVRAVFDELPPRALVVVGMDADLGTYPEIRPATRAAFTDLLGRGARLAFVSFSAEGRAIGAAEVARLRAGGAAEGGLLEVGFVPGAEAGMVRAVTDLLPAAAGGPLADAIREAGDGLAAFDLGLVVSGSDIGARSWVEQVGTRLPGLPIVAVAPTFMHPELQPYLRTGQLGGLLATVRDDAAYVATIADSGAPAGPIDDRPPPALAMLIGMVVAVALLARTLGGGLLAAFRSVRGSRA